MNSRVNLLITGATGYIGNNLVSVLIKLNYNVHIIARKDNLILKKIRFFNIPIHNYHYIDNNFNSINFAVINSKPDIVIHIASLYISNHSLEDIHDLIDSNIKFGTYLLESMRINSIYKLINTSSSWQNFNGEINNSVNLYAATKNAFNSIIMYYKDAYNFNIINLIIFDTYGVNDKRPKLINIIIDHIAKNNNEFLNMTAGNQLLDLVYIDDITNLYCLLITFLLDDNNFTNNSILNYDASSNIRYSVKDIINIFELILNIKLKINYGSLNYRFREVMNPYIGNHFPGWTCLVDLKNGLNNILVHEKLI